MKAFGKWFLLVFAVCLILYLVRSFLGTGQYQASSSSQTMQGIGSVSLLPTGTPTVLPTGVPTPVPTVASTSPPLVTNQGPSGPSSANPLCTVGIAIAVLNICDNIRGVIKAVFLDPIDQAAQSLLAPGLKAIVSTDPALTYSNPDIKGLHQTMLLATNAFLVLVILFTGIRMVWEQSAVSWSNFRETLPQVLIAFLLAQVSLQLAGAIIDLDNMLLRVIAPTGILAFGQVFPANPPLTDLFANFLEFILGIFIIVLIFEASVRIPVLNLCVVLGAAGCFALAWKPTQRLGFFWMNTFLATVFIQFLQALCLVIGLVLFRSLQGQQNTYITAIGGIAIAFAALALPFYVYRWAVQPVISAARMAVGGGERVVEGVADTAKATAMAVP